MNLVMRKENPLLRQWPSSPHTVVSLILSNCTHIMPTIQGSPGLAYWVAMAD